MRLAAPAKLNLRLLVGPRRADGYHPLHTLVVALDGLEDAVTVTPSDARRVTCPGIDGPGNLAWRALDALEAEVGRPLPVAVVIDKRIPVQAGLGGGSSDAAAALVGADRALRLGLGHERLERVAARVGSDVPFFVRGGAQWAEGRGERLRPASIPGFAAVLVKPQMGLSTADVYAAFDRLQSPSPDGGTDAPDDFASLVRWLRNDLWPAALALAPSLGAGARALAAAGAQSVLLCGSGTCLAGFFQDSVSADAAAARLAHPWGALAVVTAPRLALRSGCAHPDT